MVGELWNVPAALLTPVVGLLLFPSRGLDDTVEPQSKRFPINYCYRGEDWDKPLEGLGQTVPLAVFGALHAIAWFSTFPSVIEQRLWQASSVVPAVLAMVHFFIFLARKARPAQEAKALPSLAKKTLHLAVYLILPVSLAARYAFLVLPLLQLRDLPPLAHQTVPWADFLPHV